MNTAFQQYPHNPRFDCVWPMPAARVLADATFKQYPEDFIVREQLAFTPDGEGGHQYLCIEKTALSTPEVADALSRACDIPLVDVGYAGMKDKWALATQWFSVPEQVAQAALECVETTTGLRLLNHAKHRRKLRRGELQGNTFTITLRNVQTENLPDTIEFPNYFGPQRFGVRNLEDALQWLGSRRRRRISGFRRGLYLSVVRAYLFNEILAARVSDNTWNRIVDGDVLIADQVCGPLWGRGRQGSSGTAGELVTRVLAPHAATCDALEHAGVQQGVRPLVASVNNLEAHVDSQAGTHTLSFSLQAGSYATVWLSGWYRLDDASRSSDGV